MTFSRNGYLTTEGVFLVIYLCGAAALVMGVNIHAWPKRLKMEGRILVGLFLSPLWPLLASFFVMRFFLRGFSQLVELACPPNMSLPSARLERERQRKESHD